MITLNLALFSLLSWTTMFSPTNELPNEIEIGYHYAEIRGMSMYPWLTNGETKKVLHIKPQVGDMVAFSCRDKKCPNLTLLKFLKKQENGCYWFEGRPDPYFYNGKNLVSMDSKNTFGWVCDVKIEGVVEQICENVPNSRNARAVSANPGK